MADCEMEIDFAKFLITDNDKPDFQQILRIPCEFKQQNIAISTKTRADERKPNDWELLIINGNLKQNAFENLWCVSRFKRQIASFLNTDGGYLFYGIDRNEMITKFNAEFPIQGLKTICISILNREFDGVIENIEYDLISYKKGTLLVFKIEPFYQDPVFLKGKYQKLHCRDENGLKMIVNSDQIAKLMEKRMVTLFEEVKTFI